MVGGFLGKMFDLNRDGKLDPMERAMDFMLFNEMMKEEDEQEDEELDSGDYD